jgi:hypothetical protein
MKPALYAERRAGLNADGGRGRLTLAFMTAALAALRSFDAAFGLFVVLGPQFAAAPPLGRIDVTLGRIDLALGRVNLMSAHE